MFKKIRLQKKKKFCVIRKYKFYLIQNHDSLIYAQNIMVYDFSVNTCQDIKYCVAPQQLQDTTVRTNQVKKESKQTAQHCYHSEGYDCFEQENRHVRHTVDHD